MSADGTLCEHVPEQVFNVGWEDAPAWKVICSCGWEAWERPTEATARRAHEIHVWDEENPVASYA